MFDEVTSPTISGPIRNEHAMPTTATVEARAVAVVRSLVGNQVAEMDVTAAIATGPASPMNTCPKWMVLEDL